MKAFNLNSKLIKYKKKNAFLFVLAIYCMWQKIIYYEHFLFMISYHMSYKMY